jgi:CRP-like cAMP-binding protein
VGLSTLFKAKIGASTRMTRETLKARLARYIKTNHSQTWIASGTLQRLVAESTSYSPQNVGRRLRELENEGVLEVRYEKNHAHYKFKEAVSQMTLAA